MPLATTTRAAPDDVSSSIRGGGGGAPSCTTKKPRTTTHDHGAFARVPAELFAALAPCLGLDGHRRLLGALARSAALRETVFASDVIAASAAEAGGPSCLAYFADTVTDIDAVWARAIRGTTLPSSWPAYREARRASLGCTVLPQALRDDAQLQYQVLVSERYHHHFGLEDPGSSLRPAARLELAVLAASRAPTRTLVACPETRAWRRVVETAVASNPAALRFAAPALSTDEAWLRGLVEKYPRAFAYAGVDFRRKWLAERGVKAVGALREPPRMEDLVAKQPPTHRRDDDDKALKPPKSKKSPAAAFGPPKLLAVVGRACG